MFKTCNCTSCFPKGLNSTFQNMNSFKVRELFPWGCFAQSSRLQSLLQQPGAQHQRGDRDGWDWMCWENLDATKINDFTNSLEFFGLGLANWCEWLSIHTESWVKCEDVPFLRNYWLHGCRSEGSSFPVSLVTKTRSASHAVHSGMWLVESQFRMLCNNIPITGDSWWSYPQW